MVGLASTLTIKMTLLSEAIIAELTALYTSSTRHYHSLSHIKSLLTLLSDHRSLFTDPDAVEAAIWFHDAIYDSRATPPMNETLSADLAVVRLKPTVDAKRLEKIRVMIEGTATHTVPTAEMLRGGKADVEDAKLFLDMDLSILGAEEEEFDAYERNVRREYEWADEEAWRKGRSEVLTGLLGREKIYYSEIFGKRFEKKARENMKRVLGKLGGLE